MGTVQSNFNLEHKIFEVYRYGGMSMAIRKARPSDAVRVTHVLRLAHRENYRRGLYFSSGRMTKRKWLYKLKRETIYVASINQKIVGTISLRRRHLSIELNTLAVDPAYQKQGIGAKLLQFAEKIIKKRAFPTCHLYTLEAHPWLTRYYKKKGYKRVKIIKGNRYKTGKYKKVLH
jgi:ribosomal protein S18 acetylase RimI-like enzyme